jgi:inosine-uridine nucleoside N-ribohydrolase
MLLRIIHFLLVALFCSSCATLHKNPAQPATPTIIFDTDIGSDCDDAGALAILNKLADKGEANLLGVMFSSGRNPYGVGVCDAVNTYYGRGNLPLGQYKQDDVGDPKNSFSKEIATATNRFPHDVIDSADELVAAYKKLLRTQRDSSVTIVMVGHPCGVLQLLHDPEGSRLVKRKVTRCVAMAYAGETPKADWNFGSNGAEFCTREFLEKWPTPIYFSDAGSKILTGNHQLASTPRENPVREAYRLFQNSLLKGRPSWDLIAVLCAVRPDYFHIESVGCLEQNQKFQTFWNPAKNNPLHHRVRPKISDSQLQSIIENLMSEPPGRPTRE